MFPFRNASQRGRHQFAKCFLQLAGRAGTDATRVASYNPFVSLYWLITGKTVGGLSMYDEANRMERMEALRLWTVGSSWFSTEENVKARSFPGELADFAVLSADYFSIPNEEIKQLKSVLTIVGGKPVYAAEEFETLAPAPPPVLPDWSPVPNLVDMRSLPYMPFPR